MRFLDPLLCQCSACGAESRLAVRSLLALTAMCPACGASLRQIGETMQSTIDETAAFHAAIKIIMRVEATLGIAIDDGTIEAIAPWDRLTIGDLALAVTRSLPSPSPVDALAMVRQAVRDEFPSAPPDLDNSAPLLDVIGGPL